MFNKKDGELQKRAVEEFEKAQKRDEMLENMLLSLAKELGYEYKSRAVKRWTSSSGCIADHDMSSEGWKEEAVLERYWEKKFKTDEECDEINTLCDEAYERGFKAGELASDNYWNQPTPKKSSKKKLK